MSRRLRLAVLISGRGSNLAPLLDAIDSGVLDIDVIQVISNRADAPGLTLAAGHGVPTRVIDADGAGAGGQDAAIGALLADLDPDLVLLTGYMRILGADLVDAWRGRMINQHPSLLPKHKGLHTHRRALEAGDREHGASLHYVTRELDGGPVIAQVRIGVKAGEEADALAARLAPRERRLLLAVLPLFVQRRLSLGANGVLLDGEPLQQPLQLDGGMLNV